MRLLRVAPSKMVHEWGICTKGYEFELRGTAVMLFDWVELVLIQDGEKGLHLEKERWNGLDLVEPDGLG